MFCAHFSNHVKVNFLHKITLNAESCLSKNDSSQCWSEPLKDSTYSAQPKTWHVTENLIELPWNTRTVKSYSKATLHIWNIHQCSCQRQGDLSLWFLWASEALRPSPCEDASSISWPATVRLAAPDWAQRGTCPPTSTSHLAWQLTTAWHRQKPFPQKKNPTKNKLYWEKREQRQSAKVI